MNTIVLFISHVFAALAAERIISAFFEKRRTPRVVFILSYVLIWASLNFQSLWPHPGIAVPIYYVTLFIATLNYKSTMTRRLCALTGGHLILNSGTIVFQTFAFFTYGMFAYILETALLVATAIIYIAAFALHGYYKKQLTLTQNMHKLMIPFLFVPVTQIILIAFMQIDFGFAGIIQLTSNGLGIAFLFFYLYYSVSKSNEKDIKSALLTQEREYYYTQCRLMQESMEQVKSLRHDMKLHLATVRDFTLSDKSSEATNYLDDLLDSVGESEVYSDTGNIAFDSIINFKLKDVLSSSINLQVNILVPPELSIEVSDVVTILGNLLDNAFDAVAKVEDKMIKLDVESSKGSLYIKIDNTFDGEVKYADGADNAEGLDRVIVSRKPANGHGYGLSNIRKSAEKYDGHIDVSHEGNIFSVGILLYV
ncbi:MAG: GHKL domain-containing protein [Oscillospiraceae bacterium]|nr:GHKL domain-containing protein [Oscillospiraceae bacterium]